MHLSKVLIPLLESSNDFNTHSIDSEKLRLGLRQFESDMMDRVQDEMRVSYDMSEKFYCQDAARAFTEMFKEMAAGGGPE